MSQRWEPLPRSDLSASAIKVALGVANRLRSPEQVEEAVLDASLQSKIPNGPRWTPYGLAQGYAGLCVLWSQLDRCFPGEGWDTVAHDHLEIAVHGAVAQQMQLSPSAYSGLGGLAFATWYLSRSGARYQSLLRILDENLIRNLDPMMAGMGSAPDGTSVQAYDIISGLSGIALYLLRRRGSPVIDKSLERLVRCLVELSHEDDGLPRLHTPAHLSNPDDFMLRQFPQGYLNCGLAHGIPGPLGAMALARLSGLDCEGLDESIDRLAAWLADNRVDDEWGVNWPGGVGLLPSGSPLGRTAPACEPRAQAGWCYGSPGVARALYLAGLALQRVYYRDLAVSAIEAVLRRPVGLRFIDSPTFCHGVAGLLAIVLRFANELRSATLQEGAMALTEQLLGKYEPDSLLGFRSIEWEGKRVDQPGLLDGAPGVALVLLATGCPVNPDWDRIFLIS